MILELHCGFLFSIVFILFIFIFVIFIKYKNQKELLKKHASDLFLIYQLKEPFQHNSFNSENFQIEYILKEFLNFSFKGKKYDIGGDHIYYTKIQLKNRNYIFFINADCMGKSLQGLGGIIVLNSILSTMLSRTRRRLIERERYPETWLKYIAFEIQEIIETFNGFMMLSAVLGLIDEENGFVYYLNFDHPPTILYSAKKNEYEFIPHNNYTKLGFIKKNFNIEISRLYLEKNDILFISSDGKDEIVINGEINNDETLSLKLLKFSEGNIQTFFEKIIEIGKIRDDFSILKIKALKEFNNQTYLQYNGIRRFNNSDYIEYLKKVSTEFPYNDEFLYHYSLYLRKQKQFKEAAEMGERLLNFNKNHKKNYLNLIYCYHKLNNHQRVQSLYEEAKEIFNDNKIHKKMKNFLH